MDDRYGFVLGLFCVVLLLNGRTTAGQEYALTERASEFTWSLVAEDKECTGSEIDKKTITTIDQCFLECKDVSSMFAYKVADRHCVCETSARTCDGKCSMIENSGWNLYKIQACQNQDGSRGDGSMQGNCATGTYCYYDGVCRNWRNCIPATLVVKAEFKQQALKEDYKSTEITRSSARFQKAYQEMDVSASVSGGYGGFSASASASFRQVSDVASSSSDSFSYKKEDKMQFQEKFLQLKRKITKTITINGAAAETEQESYMDSVENTESKEQLDKRAKEYIFNHYGHVKQGEIIGNKKNIYTETACIKKVTWSLVGEKQECDGASFSKGTKACDEFGSGTAKCTETLKECAEICHSLDVTMFAWGRDSGDENRCGANGCVCLCETAAQKDGTCSVISNSGYSLYKYIA